MCTPVREKGWVNIVTGPASVTAGRFTPGVHGWWNQEKIVMIAASASQTREPDVMPEVEL